MEHQQNQPYPPSSKWQHWLHKVNWFVDRIIVPATLITMIIALVFCLKIVHRLLGWS